MESNSNLLKNRDDDTKPIRPIKDNRILFNLFTLNDDSGIMQFISTLIHYFIMTYIFVGMDSLQPIYLNDELGIDKDKAGRINSNIIIVDTIVKLLSACVYGFVIEKIKRKYFAFFSISLTCSSLILVPILGVNLTTFVCIRVCYAIGSIGLSLLPLIADYIDDSSKGRTSSLCVIFAGLGAFAGAVTNKKILESYSVNISYISMGIATFLIGIIYMQFFIEFKREKKSHSAEWNLVKLSNPNLITSYCLSFLCRGDSLLLTTFLTIWCKKYIPNDKDANIHSQVLSGIAYTFLFVTAGVFGFCIEKKRKLFQNLILLLFCVATGVLAIFIESPNETAIYVLVSLCGICFSGLQVNSLYLVNQYVEPDLRGKAMSIWGFAGVLGILIFTTLGSFLSDFYGPKIVFEVFGLLALLIILIFSALFTLNSSFRAKARLLN